MEGKSGGALGKPDSERSGTQSIERAVSLLREIATRGQFGWQLSDLAGRCGLGKSTAHRVLACLVRERLVRQRPSDRHYMPGPLLFELGLALPELGDLQQKSRSRLATIARRTSSVALLLFRSGDDFVCASSVRGDEPRALTISPGTRRPLVSSAGGAAILLALPVSEAREIVQRNLDYLKDMGRARVRAIRSMLSRTHAEGFAINEGIIVPGINAYALALRNASATPFASIMVAGSAAALPPQRFPEVRRLLEAAVEDLQSTFDYPDFPSRPDPK
jgi:DNA-binding IclR family transcriptional regulator